MNFQRSHFLVPVNSSHLKRRALGRCQTLQQQLTCVRDELLRFREEDLPRFQTWFHASFGKRCSIARVMRDEIRYYESLISRIGDEVLVYKIPADKAYQRVMQNRKQPGVRKETENSQESLSDLFDTDGIWRSESDSRVSRELPRQNPPTTADDTGTELRIKNAYRCLVRSLHPDLNSHIQGTLLAELWHEVQIAYQDRDLNRLEVLAALVRVSEEKVTEETRVSELIDVRNELERRLRYAQEELLRLEKAPAFQFSFQSQTKPKLKEIKKTVGEKLRSEILLLRCQLASLKRQLKMLARPISSGRTAINKVDDRQLCFDFSLLSA